MATRKKIVPLVPVSKTPSEQPNVDRASADLQSCSIRRSLRNQPQKIIKDEEIMFLFETSDQDESEGEESRKRRRVLSTCSEDASESEIFVNNAAPSIDFKTKTHSVIVKNDTKRKVKNGTSKNKQNSKKKNLKSNASNKKKRQIKEEFDSDSDAENDIFSNFSTSSEKTVKKKYEVESDADDKDMTDLEVQRKKNIEERMRLFQELKINEAKQELEQDVKKTKPKPYRPSKVSVSRPTKHLPRRKSLRLEGIEAVNYDDSNDQAITKSARLSLPYVPSMATYAKDWGDAPRNIKTVLPMPEVMLPKFTTEDCEQVLLSCCARIEEVDTKICKAISLEQFSLKSFKSTFGPLKLKDHHKVKVTPSRIYSMSFHPKYDGVLLAAGCKSGAVGIWNANLEHDDSDDPQIITFNHHVKPTSCVSFSKNESQILYSTSYDGTVRRGDLQQQTFTLVHFTPEDSKTQHAGWHCEISPGVLLVGQGDGNIIKVDVREPDSKSESYKCYDRSVRTIDVHPVTKHHIVTTSSTRVASIWDLRKMEKKSTEKSAQLGTLSFKKALSGAFFSPITGDKLLTTSYDDNISVFSCSDLSAPTLESKLNHNNNTGRWITNFKAMWHPQREDAFIVGSMDKPRKLQIYQADKGKCELLCNVKDDENLTTIGAAAIFHPTLPSLACGNASGYIHLFM